MDTIESSQPDKDIYIYTCRVFHNEVLKIDSSFRMGLTSLWIHTTSMHHSLHVSVNIINEKMKSLSQKA